MINIFKKRGQRNVIFRDWIVNPGRGFELIDNGDSIQYASDNTSIVIYLSVLEVEGRTLHADMEIFREPTIIEEADGWQLKGAKQGEGKVLICVVSFTSLDDEQWVRNYFGAIGTV